ncbi:MAG: hypothetical protein QM811_17590 [Pirellulales bacterium]
MLEFCLKHRVSPRDFLRLPGFSLADRFRHAESTIESLENDAPLRTLYELLVAAEG